MPLLHVTASTSGLTLPGGAALVNAAQDNSHGSIVIMVHGFRYHPGSPRHCPHASLFSGSENGWAAALAPNADTLAIGFGWPARGTIWRAWQAAAAAGLRLAALIDHLADSAPGRDIALVGHSLGVRVIASAMLALDRPRISRVLGLAGAEFAPTMSAALTSIGGRGASLLNVTTRENALFDLLLDWLVRPTASRGAPLGRGIDAPHALTLRLDCPDTLNTLAAHGFPVSPPTQRVCHGSVYSRAGVFPLYRAYLAGRLPLSRLQPRHRTARPTRLTPLFVPEPPVA